MTTLNEGTVTATRDQETADADETEFESMSRDIEPTTEDGVAQEESEVVEPDELDEDDDADDEDESEAVEERSPIAWSRVLAFGVLPAIALLLALTAGYFKWLDVSGTEAVLARTESMRVASEDAVALLSYTPESADKDLNAARERLTGEFKDAYTALTRQVVIPGAKEKRIAAVAKVNAAASVSATASHAVVLLYVNQTVTVGDGGTPTDTQPVVRVTLEKVDGRWLVSHFDPV
ncbi:MAG: Mce-associated rane protein [Mycobacterium sp.]|nr:Mce-associated rane protein [Mycobacterium sp.]